MSVISEIITSKHCTRPVIVDFQNGKVEPGQEHKLRTKLMKNKTNNTIVAAQTNKMLYLGKVDTKDDLYNTFLAVHDKQTKKIRLVQVDYATLAPQLENKRDVMETSVSVYDKSIADLKKQFGSKKSKRQTEQSERLKMNVETVKEQLEKTVADVTIDENDLGASKIDENDSLYRPRINRDASTKEQVYVLNDLVPEKVLASLEEEMTTLLNSSLTKNEHNLFPFVHANIAKIQATGASEHGILKKCCVMLYINYLMTFIMTPVKNLNRKFVICSSSELVNNHILQNFSVTSNTGGRTRPLSMKDKSLCHILIMALITLDYEMNISTLSKDIKMGLKKLTDVSRVLALTVGSKDKDVIALKLPLPAPVSLSVKRKRK